MSIKRGVTVDNNFVGGRVSQATGLNFPENACVDESNCIFNERGFVYRRPSFDFEDNYATNTVTTGNVAITTYLWRNASDDSAANLVVKQIGTTLYFYLTDSVLGLSSNILAGTIDLTTFIPAGGVTPALVECQFATGLGKLFVVNSNLTPFAVSYNATTHAIATSPITVQIRDLVGITDTVTSTVQRPVTLTDAHKYNLFNQGWDIAKNNTFFTAASNTYPSNADVWWMFKTSTNIYDPATTLASNTRGNSQSPRGYYILNAFEQNRTAASGITGIATISSNQQMPSAVAFYAGRVFYAGVNATGFSDKIYFSQIIEKDEQFGFCYQSADPTSEDVFELQPTDGGILRIPGAGQVFKLFNLGNYLVVFCANGIWMLSGNQGIGFTATDYTRSFLSSVRSISATSFVDIQGYPAWWNIDGIYYIKPDPNGGLVVDSLTDKKIKDLFLEIPIVNKKYARGAFNTFTHVVQWIYRGDGASSIEETYEFQKVLNYNILSGAFYFWTIPTTTVKTHGIVVSETGGSSLINENQVTNAAGTSDVVDGSSNLIVTFGLGSSSNIHTTTKYLVSYNTDKVTWAECANFRGDYLDWYTVDGTGIDNSADSYFVTGYKVHTEGQRRQQVPYLYVFSDNDEETEYQIQSLWDYATSADDSRWSNPQIITHTVTNQAYIRRKIRLRGHGVAVQFKINATTGKAFNIIGWSTLEDANATA